MSSGSARLLRCFLYPGSLLSDREMEGTGFAALGSGFLFSPDSSEHQRRSRSREVLRLGKAFDARLTSERLQSNGTLPQSVDFRTTTDDDARSSRLRFSSNVPGHHCMCLCAWISQGPGVRRTAYVQILSVSPNAGASTNNIFPRFDKQQFVNCHLIKSLKPSYILDKVPLHQETTSHPVL